MGWIERWRARRAERRRIGDCLEAGICPIDGSNMTEPLKRNTHEFLWALWCPACQERRHARRMDELKVMRQRVRAQYFPQQETTAPKRFI